MPFKVHKIIFLFSKDAIVDRKDFVTLLLKISISKKRCSFEHSIHQTVLKNIYIKVTNIKNINNTTVFNTDK